MTKSSKLPKLFKVPLVPELKISKIAGLKLSSAATKNLNKTKPDGQKRGEIRSRLGRFNDSSAAIMGAAYVEEALQDLLLSHFVNLGKDEQARIFDGAAGGILGGFSSKIRVGYATGLFGPVAQAELLLLNDIRNVFAHSLHKVSFKNEHITQDCGKFTLHRLSFKKNTDLDLSYANAKEAYCETANFLMMNLVFIAIKIAGDRMVQNMHDMLRNPSNKEGANSLWGDLI